MILTHGANSLARGCDFVEIGGRRYPVVKIGDQFWLAENLAYDDGNGGIVSNTSHPEYGLYYNQEAALRVANDVDGWHLPSMGEFEALYTAAGVINIKSDSGWNDDANGTNLYGFSLYPYGWSSDGTTFTDIGDMAYLWASNNYGGTGRCSYVYKDNSQTVMSIWTSNRANVRLVKDSA